MLRSNLRLFAFCIAVVFGHEKSIGVHRTALATEDAVRSPPPPGPKVITLGDSFSSGAGIHGSGSKYDEQFGGIVQMDGRTYKMRPGDETECWRETDDTPGPILASELGIESVVLACKRAEIDNVGDQFDYLNALYPIERSYNWENSTFLITIGGNDLRFKGGDDWPALMSRCIVHQGFFGDCSKKEWSELADNVLETIRGRLVAFLTKVADEAGSATIRFLGYPRLLQQQTLFCGFMSGLGRGEADYMDAVADDLNLALMSAVTAVQSSYPLLDLQFVDVYNYLTVGACGNMLKKHHIHFTRFDGIMISDASFHPSRLGYAKYYEALKASL